MISSISNDLFLLFANLVQINDEDLLIHKYTSALNNLFVPVKFILTEKLIGDEFKNLPLSCNDRTFGFVVFDRDLNTENFSLFANSVQMISVLLERLYQNELLNNKETHLNALVAKRISKILEEKDFNYNVIDALTDTYFLFDPFEEKAIQWNNAFCKISGYSNNEIAVMKAPYEFYGKKDLEKVEMVLPLVLNEGKATVELNLKCKDGHVVPTEYQISLINNKVNGSTLFISIGRDITYRKIIEKKLKISQDRLSLSLSASRASVFERNLKTKKITISPELFLCLGYEEKDIPKTIEEFNTFIYPDDIHVINDAFEFYLEGYAQYYYCEFKIRNSNDDWIWCNINGKIVKYDKNHDPVILVGIVKDNNFLKVSELAIMQQNDEIAVQNEEYQTLNNELEESLKQIQLINIDLQKAMEKAEESDRLKSAFLANMSHEIRTPMNSILGFSGFLTDDSIDHESRKKYASLVENSGYYLLRLIDDIIDISKIESNQLDVWFERVKVNLVIDEIMAVAKNEAAKRKKKHIEIFNINNCEIDNLECITDKIRLNQILINLLTNALKYTQKGSITYGVNMVTENMIEFYVSDTGKGIENKNLELIFERFRQIETETYREGTGLGLSITRGLVRLLGGEIWVQSKVNEGSSFNFTIKRN